MGLVNTKILLKNPRKPDIEPIEVEALADSGAIAGRLEVRATSPQSSLGTLTM